MLALRAAFSDLSWAVAVVAVVAVEEVKIEPTLVVVVSVAVGVASSCRLLGLEEIAAEVDEKERSPYRSSLPLSMEEAGGGRRRQEEANDLWTGTKDH